MKIVELRTENFKRLSAVTIRPDGSLVQITGKNAQGKTSVLDALWAVFAGKSACPVVPIRTGQESALIRVDLGEMVVTRTFQRSGESEYTTEIKVENQEGARYPGPQKMLDAFLGALSFDPLEFARMEPRAQYEALRRFVPEVDFAAIGLADRMDRDKRTDIGRVARQERAAAEIILVPPSTPEKAIDVTALVAELEQAGVANTEREQRVANRQAAAGRIEQHARTAAQIRTRISDLRAEADKLEALAQAEDDGAKALNKRLDEAEPLPEPIDTGRIREQIDGARAANANVAKRETKDGHKRRADQLDAEYEGLTQKIEDRQAAKDAAIAAAKMPIDGLGFGEDMVLLNGLPFSQASDAEQLRTSVAIAMALNPKLRVIRVRDGSLLDDDAMKLLGEKAAESDYQVWIERVDSTGKIGFVLEDGHLKADANEERRQEGIRDRSNEIEREMAPPAGKKSRK